MLNPNLDGFDHLTVLVRDLEGAHAAYERLGFNLSKRNTHPDGGTANHVMVLAKEYLEIITITHETQANQHMVQMQKAGDGLRFLAVRTPDVAAVKADLDKKGVASVGPMPVDRKSELPDGTIQHAHFSVLVPLPPGAISEPTFFFNEHKNPELVFDAGARHPNGAIAVASLHAPVADVGAWAKHLENVLGAEPVRREGDSVFVDTGSALVEYMSASAWPHQGASGRIVMSTSDLAKTRKQLAASGVRFEDQAGVVRVPASAAFGVVFDFRHAG